MNFSRIADLSLNGNLSCNLIVATCSNNQRDMQILPGQNLHAKPLDKEILAGDTSGCVLLRVSAHSDHFNLFSDIQPGTVLVVKNANIICHLSKLKVAIANESSVVIQNDIVIHPHPDNNISQVEYIQR